MKNFVEKTLKSLNKTEQELQKESVEQFAEDSTIECQQQISTLEVSVIPSLKAQLKREEKKLERANKAVEAARFSTASSFDQYVANKEAALEVVDDVKSQMASIEQEISDNEAKLESFKEILADLTA